MGNVNIQDSRLESLRPPTRRTHRSLENHAGIQAGDRQRAGRVFRLPGRDIVEFIARIIENDARCYEPTRLLNRQFNLWRRIEAPTGYADIAIKINKLSIESVT